jgi:hypothetical protein
LQIKSDGAVTFPGWAFYLSGGQIFFRIYQTSTGTGFRLSTDDTFNDGEYHSVVVTYGGLNGLSKGGAGTKIYVDNQLVDTTLSHDVAFTASTLNSNDYRIGMASYGSLWFDGCLCKVIQFGVELSAQEATQLLTEMNTAIPYTAVDFKSDTRYINAIADGMMKKTGTDDWIVDGVGGVLSKVSDPERGQVLAVYSGAGNITYAYQYNLEAGYYRLKGWLRGDGTGGTARIKVGGTWMTGSNATSTWQMIDEVLYNPSAANVPFKMGQTAATTNTCYYSDIECIKLNSANENDFASPHSYIADGKGWNESVGAVASGFLENTGWTVDAGAYLVQTDDDNFGKYFYASGASSLASMPNPLSCPYGQWEFDLWKGFDSGQPYVSFLQDKVASTFNANGYQFVVSSTEQVLLRRTDSGSATTIISGSVGAFPIAEWVHVKITRDTFGYWKVWVNDVQVGSRTLENTYTSGLPFVSINSAATAGDRYKNFKIIPYIQ